MEFGGIFKSFRRTLTPRYLGVDIGTTSIKAVEVKQGERSPAVVNYGILESSGHLLRENNVLQTSALKIFEDQAAEFLKALVARMKPGTADAVASLPPFAAFMATLNFPSMSPADLKKTMAFRVKDYVPMAAGEAAIDWLKVGDYTDDKGYKHDQILLISVAKDQIRKYQKIFKSAGLDLRALEIESLSLARVLSAGDPTITAMVDIGSRSTNIAIAGGGELKLNAQSDFASASLTDAISRSLNINPLRAEELKTERGIVGSGANYELSTIMLPILDVIISEVKRARFAYKSQFSGARDVERAIICGGGANLAGIEKYFEAELGLPVVKAAPFSRFEYRPDVEPLVPELNPLLSVSLGLAGREFV